MKKLALTSVLSLSIAATMPTGARADLKDVIIGVGVGALASEAIRRERAKKKTYRSSTKSSRPATINSQYTREEKRGIQASLNALGYNVGTVDGSLGPRSRSAISQFQVARGEAGTGQLTRPQFVALMGASGNPSAAFVVDRRLSRDEVVLMQTGLQRLGFYTSRVDGAAGPGTRRAREGFLYANGHNPMTITQVQSAVLAAQAAGLPVPPYLMQEAQLQYQQANAPQQPEPFGQAAPQQPQTFTAGVTAPQTGQQLFGTPQTSPQQPQGAALFGTPTQPQQGGGLFGAAPQQPQPQGGGLFGTPQPQAPAAGGQQLFATQPQGQAPAPQGGAVQLFGTQPQAPAQQAPAQGGSTLDIYAGRTAAPQTAPGTQAAKAPAAAPLPEAGAAQLANAPAADGAVQPTVSMFANPEGGGLNPLRRVLDVVTPATD